MDALDFGHLVHHALAAMAAEESMRRCRDERELSRFLKSRAEQWVITHFGKSPALQISLQLEAARRRLEAAARVQAEMVKDGWEILDHEVSLAMKVGDALVTGRIDRVARHQETGQ